MIRNGRFEFVGKYSWLDFVNTEFTKPDSSVDALHDLTDLIDWLLQVHLINRDQAHQAMKSWAGAKQRPASFDTPSLYGKSSA